MRDGVDGETRESRARFWAIGRDHLGKLGHEFGRDHQLRYNCPRGPSGHAVGGHGKNQPSGEPMRSIRTSVSQNASGVAKGS
jgi:hypothetical protein